MPFLAPASFTIIMGTGAFAIATLEMAKIFPSLAGVASFLNVLNFVLFCLLAIWATASWPKNRDILHENFEHPDNCALYAALGIAILVLGAQALRFGFARAATISIWTFGAILTLAFNYGILFRFFLHPGLEIAQITPTLFVPAASMVVLPVAGAPICAMLDGIAKNLVMLACILALGGGLALYVGLFSLMLQRHLLARPLPDQLAPTLWIHVAPIGWAGVSLLSFAHYIFPAGFEAACQVPALLLFGASLWWLIMAALICARAVCRKKIFFSMAWWSFIFPLGSVTILAARLDVAATKMLFPWLWCIMAFLWLYCAIKSVNFLRRY